MELTAIKVTMGLRANGHTDHPDFNVLPSVIASDLDWSIYVDQNGSGWKYDCCGHEEEEPGSPFGTWIGMLLVPAAFAAEAVNEYPGTISQLTSAEATAFYDDKHASGFDEEILDLDIIEGIIARDNITPSLGPRTDHQDKAMDKNDDTPGVRLNRNKTLALYIATKGFTIAP